MADAATVNALKAIAKALEDQTRELKEIRKIAATLNHNFIQVHMNSNSTIEPTPETKGPCYMGWNTAAALQIDGQLKVGDIKYEQDESLWYWVGENWERIEVPSSGPTAEV